MAQNINILAISPLLHCGMNVTFLECLKHSILCTAHQHYHGLRTPNEGINQRYLKNWADVADKICFGRTKKFGIGIEFSAMQ